MLIAMIIKIPNIFFIFGYPPFKNGKIVCPGDCGLYTIWGGGRMKKSCMDIKKGICRLYWLILITKAELSSRMNVDSVWIEWRKFEYWQRRQSLWNCPSS
jgi:hypothetical protein